MDGWLDAWMDEEEQTFEQIDKEWILGPRDIMH